MIISTKRGTPAADLDRIVKEFESKGLEVTLIRGTDYNVFGLVGDTTILDEKQILANPYVDNVQRVSEPYKKANRLFHGADSVIDVSGVKVGGKEKIAVIGGPCSVEGEQETVEVAKAVKAALIGNVAMRKRVIQQNPDQVVAAVLGAGRQFIQGHYQLFP